MLKIIKVTACDTPLWVQYLITLRVPLPGLENVEDYYCLKHSIDTCISELVIIYPKYIVFIYFSTSAVACAANIHLCNYI